MWACILIGLIGALDLKKGAGSHLNGTYLPLSFRENSYEHMLVELVHVWNLKQMGVGILVMFPPNYEARDFYVAVPRWDTSEWFKDHMPHASGVLAFLAYSSVSKKPSRWTSIPDDLEPNTKLFMIHFLWLLTEGEECNKLSVLYFQLVILFGIFSTSWIIILSKHYLCLWMKVKNT